MNLNIRPFRPEDYRKIMELDLAVFPEYPYTEEELRYSEGHRDKKCLHQRWMGELDGKVVGMCKYEQFPGTYHPRKFWIDVMVLPDYRRRGIGSALYEHVMASLERFDPVSVKNSTREDMTSGIRFLERRGFKEQRRSWESRLDVNSFDFAPYVGTEEKVRSKGIEIRTIKELEGDPDRNRKLYELDNELFKDVPTSDLVTEIDFEHFLDMVVRNPRLMPDGYFIAVHEGEYVGETNLWSTPAMNDIYTGFTGVKRSHRRMGIALALKLRGIAYAKAHGHQVIRTNNDSLNRPILSINERLGFVKQPAWITFIKTLKDG